jgi:hypothetical protein
MARLDDIQASVRESWTVKPTETFSHQWCPAGSAVWELLAERWCELLRVNRPPPADKLPGLGH